MQIKKLRWKARIERTVLVLSESTITELIPR